MKWNPVAGIALVIAFGFAAPLSAACFTDAYEPNDTCGAAAPVEAGLHTPLYVCADEHDWYAVEVPAGHVLKAEVLFTHSGGSDFQAQLWDESCTTSLDASYSATDNELVEAAAAGQGRTVHLRTYGADAADEGSYEVQIDLECPHCFTYQGQLQEAGAPANGSYEMSFRLYDAVSSGNPLTDAYTYTLDVNDGLFSANLYMGDPDVYSSAPGLFLQIGVRPADSADSFTDLSPRQELTPAPRALSLVPGGVISGTPDGSGSSLSLIRPDASGSLLQTSGGYTAVTVEDTQYGLYVNNTTYDGIFVDNAGWRGLAVIDAGTTGVYASTGSNSYWAGYFENNGPTDSPGTGLYANGNLNSAVDLQLGGSIGRIAANSTPSADLYQVANSEVVVDLDENDDNSNSFFGIRNGTNQYLFYIYESGAGYFTGDLNVDGSLSKASGSFVIDHLLDPENKLLYHSFVESPDMMNVYNGNVTLDAQGEAWVDLPGYFQVLNRDFRYQLTAIGAPGPNLYVAEEVADNRFRIAGGTAGMKVSWQVTGIRQDAYANANRIQVEVDKSKDEQGRYLHPEAWGQSNERKLQINRPIDDIPPEAPSDGEVRGGP